MERDACLSAHPTTRRFFPGAMASLGVPALPLHSDGSRDAPQPRQKAFDPRLRDLAIRMRRGVSVTTRTKGLLKFEAVFMGNSRVLDGSCVSGCHA